MTYMIPFNRTSRRLVPLENNFSNMLDDFFSDSLLSSWGFSKETFKVDVQENDESYLIEADLPGINKEEVNLEMKENTLYIQVAREEENDESDKNYVHKERRYSSMSRSVYLRDVEQDNIDAKLENGVLSVTVPKVEKSQRIKQIDIK